MYVCMYVCKYACTHACMYACMYGQILCILVAIPIQYLQRPIAIVLKPCTSRRYFTDMRYESTWEQFQFTCFFVVLSIYPILKPPCHIQSFLLLVACLFFTTCQVRIVRFYVSCPASSSSSSSSSSFSLCSPSLSPPHPNTKLRIRVFPPDPNCKLLDRSFPLRTRTASSGPERSPPDPNCKRQTPQCSPPDPNRKHRIRVLPAGPQLQALDRSVPRRARKATSGSK